jgi:hypothetical protein
VLPEWYDKVALTTENKKFIMVYYNDYKAQYRGELDLTSEEFRYLLQYTSENLKLVFEREDFPYQRIKDYYRRNLAYIRLRL